MMLHVIMWNEMMETLDKTADEMCVDMRQWECEETVVERGRSTAIHRLTSASSIQGQVLAMKRKLIDYDISITSYIIPTLDVNLPFQ